MNIKKQLLEVERDEMLDEIEKLNCLIYEEICAIEKLEKEIKEINQ